MTVEIRLTTRQQQVFAFCREFFAENDQMPTAKNVAAHFGFRSANAACEVTAILERKQVLARNANEKFKRGPTWEAACLKYGSPLDVCRKCGGTMGDGIALDQTATGKPDFPGGDVVTMSPGGSGRVIGCKKCRGCGWSTT